MRARMRHLAPPGGRRYELLDTSVLLAGIGLFGYILGSVPMAVINALFWLYLIPEAALGWFLVTAGCVGVACAYNTRPTIVRVGYAVGMFATGVMVLNFLWGAAFTDLGWRGLSSALIYAWMFRRLTRDNDQEGGAAA